MSEKNLRRQGLKHFKLFVNDKLVASSTEFNRNEYNLSNEETLKLVLASMTISLEE
jgi:hypothetical protein